MQPGSIVELTKSLTRADIRILKTMGIPLLEKDTPYVITHGPFKQVFPPPTTTVIILQERPGRALNAEYFSEVQPPMPIEIEDIIHEEVTA